MNMLEDKNRRLELQERYLDAETSLEEERSLRDFYATHPADPDEKAIARLLTVLPAVPGTPASSGAPPFPAPSDRDLLSPESGSASQSATATSSSPCRHLLSPEGATEFDAILVARMRRRRWLRIGGIAAAAACFGIFLLLSPPHRPHKPQHDSLSPIEIAEQLQTLINLNIETIESITARPAGDGVVITAKQKDGTESYFLILKDGTDSSYRLLALNH